MYYINVNRQTIQKNAKYGTNEPPVSFRKGKNGKSTYCHELEIENGRIIYNAQAPVLKCGARLVILTKHEPKIIK